MPQVLIPLKTYRAGWIENPHKFWQTPSIDYARIVYMGQDLAQNLIAEVLKKQGKYWKYSLN